ncbi:MAG: endolytic transglycosylase MltG [Gammaproteobacteria bacterium]|nr:endolytic transglycosylase MltG [Gammaproteobacteria bacterium]
MKPHHLRLAAMVAFIAAVALGAHVWNALTRPTIPAEHVIALTVDKGDSFSQVTDKLIQHEAVAGSLYAWIAAKLLGAETRIKAGEYVLLGPMTTLRVLKELIDGGGVLHRQTFFEGWTTREILEALKKNPTVKKTENPLARFGYSTAEEAEGACLPDTYKHYRGDPDYKILELCIMAMRETLEELWATRASGLPYDNPRDALILASIVEAETTLHEERPEVAGVIISRLRKNMRLQTDPTVIYGLGPDFDNNLTRKHLREDPAVNPYNTYRIYGLPPGPICNPGRRSLEAALQPDLETENLYYVAVGDGSHYFSKTYEEHVKAVRKYQLGKK